VLNEPLSLTPSAREKLKSLATQRTPHACGVRIKLRTRGCSGLSYVLEYIDQPLSEDIPITVEPGLFLYIQSKALMFLVGTQMDYQETAVRSGFVFENPNEKGRCGCGSSFHV
jgi:iron-sulfur cluster assembly protein